jgi:hypothetical protein
MGRPAASNMVDRQKGRLHFSAASTSTSIGGYNFRRRHLFAAYTVELSSSRFALASSCDAAIA